MSANRCDWCGRPATFWTPIDLAALVVMPSCGDHLPHATETGFDVTAVMSPKDLAAPVPTTAQCRAWRASAKRARVRVDRCREDAAPHPREAFDRFVWTTPDGRTV